MFKITVKVDTNLSGDELLWHNLKVADTHMCLSAFIGCSEAWFQMNKGKGYQDLEKELRARKFQTHLIAVPPTLDNPRFTLKSRQKECVAQPKWECITSCRPQKYALAELMQHSASYEENFEKLKDAGTYFCLEDDVGTHHNLEEELKKEKDCFLFSKREAARIEMLKNNAGELEIETFDNCTKYIQSVADDLKELDPNIVFGFVAMLPDGSPVIGFTLDGKLAHHHAISITATSDGKVIRLVSLQ